MMLCFYENLDIFQMNMLSNLNDEIIVNAIMETVYSVSTSCLNIMLMQNETEEIIDEKEHVLLSHCVLDVKVSFSTNYV